MKILIGKHITQEPEGFDNDLVGVLPRLLDLQRLPYESLDDLLTCHGVERCGSSPTAASNALATLELHTRLKNVVNQENA